MHINEYQFAAMSTRMPTADETYSQLGLAGEVGELLGYIAKCRRDGVAVDVNYICKELGDVLWFVASIAEDFDIQLGAVAQKNLTKLKGRKERGTLGGNGNER